MSCGRLLAFHRGCVLVSDGGRASNYFDWRERRLKLL